MSKPFKISPNECVQELSRAGLLDGSPNPVLSNKSVPLKTDSRDLKPGEIFLAYRGVHFDSHTILPEISNAKPALIIHESDFDHADIPCLKVKNARAAWAQLAAFACGHPQEKLKLIGVTGTNGKTSTVFFIRQLLGNSCAAIGTLGAYIGSEEIPTAHTTPDPPELYRFLSAAADAGMEYLAMEVSSHAMAQDKLFPLRFDFQVFTSFTRDHLDLHKTMEDYWLAKEAFFTKLSQQSTHVFLSGGLERREQLGRLISPTVKRVCTYGFANSTGAPPDYEIAAVSMESEKTTLAVHHSEGTDELVSNLVGDFAYENLLAAVLVAAAARNTDLSDIETKTVLSPPGRLQRIMVSDAPGPQVFVDYAHTPDALARALTALRPAATRRLIVVFGCGGDRDRGKRPEMAEMAERHADFAVVTSDNPRYEDPQSILSEIDRGFSKPAKRRMDVDRRRAIHSTIEDADPDDIILIAGKGHETYMDTAGKLEHFDDAEEARAAITLRGER